MPRQNSNRESCDVQSGDRSTNHGISALLLSLSLLSLSLLLLGDTYEVYVSPIDFVKIFIYLLFIYLLSGGLYLIQTTL